MKNQNKKLWQTGANLDPEVEEYTVGVDYLLDQKLLPYDIQASLAHAKGLQKIGILTTKEFNQLKKGLKEILNLWKKGKFIINREQEDVHTAIEQYLTNNYGEVGKKIHTGRSRNDQALVMIRLFMKKELQDIDKLLQNLIKVLQLKTKQYKNISMPGYTHTQKAMPTTVDVWLNSFAEALKDVNPFFLALKKIIDQSPLGSAAGFGINNLSLDKNFTAKLLGFKKVQTNPMYCGLSRGYFESVFLQTLSPVVLIIIRLTNDLLLFTTQEFDFFALPSNMTTGSSIMPQKRNYDILEIIRANIVILLSAQREIQDIIKPLISGYHRDLQLTKKIFLENIFLTKSTIKIMIKIVDKLVVKEDNLNKAMTKELFATEKVYELVSQGMSFREAYQRVKISISTK